MGYHIEGNLVLNQKGVTVATLNENGGITMSPGKRSQEDKVRAFLAENTGVRVEVPPTQNNNPSWDDVEAEARTLFDQQAQGAKVFVGDVPIEHVEPVEQQNVAETDAEWYVRSIPEDRLPPFSPMYGVNTPGFRAFIEENKLTKEQTAALVRRLEKGTRHGNNFER